MKKSVLAISIVILLALVLATFFIFINNSNSSNSGNLSLGNISQVSGGSVSSVNISQSMLSNHNSKNDCWVVYRGKVYDISSFIPNHPGGESPIARTCGTTNFEDAFTNQHGTSKANLFMKVTTYEGEFVQ